MSDILNARLVLFSVTGLSYAIVLILAPVVGLNVDLTGLPYTCSVVTLCMIFAAYICKRNQAYRLRAVIENYFCCLLLILPEMLSVYLADRLNMPWADAQLSALDHILGWDWRAVISLVDSSSIISLILRAAYSSFSFQLAVIPIILAARGQLARSYHMVIVSALMCFACALISVWFPAIGTYSYYNIDVHTLRNLDTTSPFVFLHELVSAKEDPNFVFSLSRAAGITTFPSMHAAMSVLCAWSAWQIATLRYPFLLLNTLMCASAMIVSNHYLVDVIAGVGVAGLSISGFQTFINGLNRLTAYRHPSNAAGEKDLAMS